MKSWPSTVVGVGALKPCVMMRDEDTVIDSIAEGSCAYAAEATVSALNPAVTKSLDFPENTELAPEPLRAAILEIMYSPLVFFPRSRFVYSLGGLPAARSSYFATYRKTSLVASRQSQTA